MTRATVGRLWHYPVKSMQGEEVDEVLLAAGGVVGDRAYGFVDVETGRLVSAKRPKRFGPILECQARFLTAPAADAPPPPIEVVLPDGAVVRDDMDLLAVRVSELLGREVRCISTVPADLMRDAPQSVIDALDFDGDADDFVPAPVAAAAPGRLVDLAPLHILTVSTLRRLSIAHPGDSWDPRRMRPNMLLDCDGYPVDEDDWLGCDLHLGDDAVVHVAGPTPRCVMTTLAQPGLPKDPAVLKTIAALGRKDIGKLGQFACAGSYAEVVTPGVVRRGDTVRIERVQPRRGALAATIDAMETARAADQ